MFFLSRCRMWIVFSLSLFVYRHLTWRCEATKKTWSKTDRICCVLIKKSHSQNRQRCINESIMDDREVGTNNNCNRCIANSWHAMGSHLNWNLFHVYKQRKNAWSVTLCMIRLFGTHMFTLAPLYSSSECVYFFVFHVKNGRCVIQNHNAAATMNISFENGRFEYDGKHTLPKYTRLCVYCKKISSNCVGVYSFTALQLYSPFIYPFELSVWRNHMRDAPKRLDYFDHMRL